MGIFDAIAWHYNNVRNVRTERQLEKEKTYLCFPFNRYLLFPAALLIQMCAGSLYAWSGFNLPIERYIYGPNIIGGKAIDRGIAANVFYVAVAIFALTAAIVGPWMERHGPRISAMIGASLFFLGNLITALGVWKHQMPVVFFGYGFIGAAGLGICYISPVSPLQKWFPDLRGLAAGFAVCGFGAGSIFSPYTQKALIGPNYQVNGQEFLGVPLTFVILGACYFVVMMISATVLRMPPPNYERKGITISTIKGAEKFNLVGHSDITNQSVPLVPLTHQPGAQVESNQPVVQVESNQHSMIPIQADPEIARAQGQGQAVALVEPTNPFDIPLRDALRSSEFIKMYFMFMGNEILGLLIISRIQSIVTTQFKQSTATGVAINSALGGVNLAGRLIVPTISDLVGVRKPFYLVSLFCQAIFLGFLPYAIDHEIYALCLVCAFVIAFFYGSGFGLIPAFLADQFGSKNVGPTHGIILTAWGFASVVGGLIFSKVYELELAKAVHEKRSILTVFDLNFHWLLLFPIAAFFITLFIKTDLISRRLPYAPGESVRFRFLNGRLVRFIGLRPTMLSKQEEARMWNEHLANNKWSEHAVEKQIP